MADSLFPRMQEAYNAADKAAVSNRTIYPVTITTNVFSPDGTPLETDGAETTETGSDPSTDSSPTTDPEADGTETAETGSDPSTDSSPETGSDPSGDSSPTTNPEGT